MPVPLNRKVLDFTIFFNINCYGANDFPYTEEGQDSQRMAQLGIMRRFLLCRIFPSALSQIRKRFYHNLLNLFGHLDGFPGTGMFQGSDYSCQLLISKRFY